MFVTIVTFHRNRYFGKVIDGVMVLSDVGHIAHEHFNVMGQRNAIQLHAFVVMPDHVHCAFTIVDCPLLIIPKRGFGAAIPGTCSTIIRSYKSSVTKTVREAFPALADRRIWQSGFHESLITPDALPRVISYIVDNPRNWGV